MQAKFLGRSKLVSLLALLFVFIPSIQSSGNEASDAVMVAGRKFFTDGPIRYAPATWERRTYVGSDDGYLYCFDEDGQLLWKFFSGYSNRKLIMVGRMIMRNSRASLSIAWNGRSPFNGEVGRAEFEILRERMWL